MKKKNIMVVHVFVSIVIWLPHFGGLEMVGNYLA